MARTNRTRYVLLGSLTEGPKTGYTIRKEIEEGISHFWQESFGQIYPVLSALADEGLAERRTERTGHRERHLYSITDLGRRELADWLEQPVEDSPVRNELLLKLIFGRNTRPEVLIGHLETFRAKNRGLEEALAAIEAEVGKVPPDHPDLAYWRMTLRAGRAIAEARLRWADETLTELRALAEAHANQPYDGRDDG